MMQDIAILAIIWLSVFVASYLAHKTRLTPVLWYIFIGTLLVNINLLPQIIPPFIHSFSELGIIIIMFALGFEEDSNNFLSSIKRSWGIALFGAAAPFSVAYYVTWLYWGNANIALLSGLAMTATSVSLTIVSLKSEGLHNTPAATGIMTSAVLDDVASLIFVALLVPIAIGESNMNIDAILLIIAKAITFFVIVTILGGWLFPVSQGWLRNIPIIGLFSLRTILAMARGEYTVLSLLLIAVLVGLLANYFGFHPAIGAYMAGLIIHREYFDFHRDKQVDFYRQAREIIDNVAFSWIGPVFFVTLGSKLIFDHNLFLLVLPEACILFVALFLAQVISAALAARFTGNFDWSSSLLIGFGMLGRAELTFVVLDIAYVEHNIFSQKAFYILMLTIFLLNFSLPFCIRWWKGHFKITN